MALSIHCMLQISLELHDSSFKINGKLILQLLFMVYAKPMDQYMLLENDY